MVGPSESLCRERFQTALSCFGPMTAVVNVKEKARPMDRVMWGVGRRAQANLCLKGTSGSTVRPKVLMRRQGADCSVVSDETG